MSEQVSPAHKLVRPNKFQLIVNMSEQVSAHYTEGTMSELLVPELASFMNIGQNRLYLH